MKKALFLLLYMSIFTLHCLDTNTNEKFAKKGSINAMFQMLEKCKQDCLATKNPKTCEKTFAWYFRSLIRIRQDAACRLDPSVNSLISVMKMVIGPKIQRELIENNCMLDLSDEKQRERLIKALKWVQKRTSSKNLANDILPSPEEISKYGMQQFLEAFGGEHEKTITLEELWQEKRQEILDKYYEAFNISKPEV